MKLRKFIVKNRSEMLLITSLILISIISFNLGRLKALKEVREPLKIYDDAEKAGTPQFQVVASRNSNKYHFPWCSGAMRINPENKIVFENEEAAIAAGYILAGNCSK